MKQAQRIQTSFINGVEKKALVWLAGRQPRWMTSDMMTAIGVVGALLVAAGFVLSRWGVEWLWLSSFGLLVNWYGDSLDGTLARVRNRQRPVYGYYVDHMMDCVNEGLMFVGAGLSPFLRLDIALADFALYLALTVSVCINAYLKGEFRLTYFKLGPTEYRLLVMVINTLLVLMPSLRAVEHQFVVCGHDVVLHLLDYVGMAIMVVMLLIFVSTLVADLKKYAVVDPQKCDDA